MDNERIAEISKDLAYWEGLGTRPDMSVAMELLEEVKRLSEYVDPDAVVITESNNGYQFAYNNILDEYEDLIGERPFSHVTLGRLLALEGIREVSVVLPVDEDEIFYIGAQEAIDRVNSCAKNWGILIDKKRNR